MLSPAILLIDNQKIPLNFRAVQPGSTITLNKIGSPAEISLYYSFDGNYWIPYVIGQTITLQNIGDRVYFKGDNTTFSSSTSNFYRFSMTGKIEAYGNLNSLYDASCTSVVIPNDQYFFAFLFDGCDSLMKAPLMPATTLRNRCYYTMYRGTSIKYPPQLPARSLISYCYQRTFMNCIYLVSTPILLTESMAYSGCYYATFNGCSSLKYVHCNLISWPTTTNATASWLVNVAASGIFVCPSSLDTTIRDESHIPVGWEVRTF